MEFALKTQFREMKFEMQVKGKEYGVLSLSDDEVLLKAIQVIAILKLFLKGL